MMRILDISPYGIYPPKNGTHKRIFYLNLFEAKKNNVINIFSQSIRPFEKKKLLSRGIGIWKINITPNYSEYRYVNPLSLTFSLLFYKLGLQPPIMTGNVLKVFKPQKLLELMYSSDIIKVEFPWQVNAIYDILSLLQIEKPVILVEHNVEYELITQIIKTKKRFTKFYKKISEIVYLKEHEALNFATHIIAVSEKDKKNIYEIYRIPKRKITVIPNGVNTREYRMLSSDEKLKLKHQYGLKDKIVILFVGFNYYPNIIAAKYIIELSRQLPKNIAVFIVGSVGDTLKDISTPKNVIVTGYVNEIKHYLQIADIALNPMTIGSGSNVKMFEYMASGLPVITTPLGARGIEGLENYKNAIISDLSEFPQKLLELINNKELREEIGKNARKLVEERYDWEKLAECEVKILQGIIS